MYGGYFGAGLGILLLAVLALALSDSLHRLNALKEVLSLVIGAAASSLAGGQAGVSAARRLPAPALRAVIVVFGVGVALWLLVRGG